MGTGYFRYEPRRLSYAELARLVRGQGSPLMMWIMKTLGISWRSAWARKYPSSIREWRIDGEELLVEIARALAEARAEFTAAGFEAVAFIGQAGSLYPLDSATEIYRHTSGCAIATITCSRMGTLQRKEVAILSRLHDGAVLSTASRSDLNPPPGHFGKEICNASLLDVWKAHQGRLAAASGVETVSEADAALDFYERIEQATWDSLIKRRIMVECTTEEVELAQRRLEKLASLGEEAKANAAVMVEMVDKLERRQTRREVLWAFCITLLLFLLVGFVWWEPKMLWMLAVALAVHEFGHYLTMRLFGYQNLRMIFVPLGGAAVIGQNFNVPGWKKAIVSLMGPLPGILIALGLSAWTYFYGPNEMRFEVAIMFLVLNALNLLPVFPMDGGMYLNAILFCRNAKFEVVFKAIAVVVLAVAAVALRDFILGAVAYFLFFRLMPSYRLARMTERLRGEIDVPAVNDPNDLPLEIKNRVIDGVKEALRKPASAKVIAAYALGVFERLNARPPRAAATVFLLVVYVMTFGLALLCPFALGLSGVRQARSGPITPDTLWLCDQGPVRVIEKPVAPRLAAMTFKTIDNREAFIEAARAAFPTNQPFAVGRTVFMPYAREDAKKLVRELRRQFGSLVVESDQKNGERRRPTCYWRFSAPNEEAAGAIEKEISDYVTASESPDPAGAAGAERLGRLAGEGDTGAEYGDVERNGRDLRVEIQFSRMEQGFPTFVNWLCSRNCEDIFYTFKRD